MLFFTFFKLYKWYQIAQHITYLTLLTLSCFFSGFGFCFFSNFRELPFNSVWLTPQIRHVYFTLKWHGNDRLHCVSTWNTCGVFVGMFCGNQLVLVFQWSFIKAHIIITDSSRPNGYAFRYVIHVSTLILPLIHGSFKLGNSKPVSLAIPIVWVDFTCFVLWIKIT